jgi:type II secretory pathway pseudopilin PulG
MKCMSASSGFSVLEVLAGLSIFSLVAAGLTANSIAAIRSNRVSRGLSVAAALAQDKLEQLRALDPSTGPADLTAGFHADPGNPLSAAGQSGGPYVRRWTVTADTPALGLSTVVVTVSRGEGAGRAVRMVGYVCSSQACV